jgi:hypothetical protein
MCIICNKMKNIFLDYCSSKNLNLGGKSCRSIPKSLLGSSPQFVLSNREERINSTEQ